MMIELFYGFLILFRMRDGDFFEVGLEGIPVSFIFRAVVKGCKVLVETLRCDIVFRIREIDRVFLSFIVSYGK